MFRNFLKLTSGDIAARLIHGVGILWLARVLRPQGLGTFELAVAINTYALLAVQQGFDTIGIRDVSRNRSLVVRYARNFVAIRLTLACIVAVMMAAASAITLGSHAASLLLLILSGTYFANALSPRWLHLALEKPHTAAIAPVLSQTVFLASIVLGVRGPEQAWVGAMGWVAGEFVSTAFLYSQLGWPCRDKLPLWDRSFAHWLWRESRPVSASLLLGNLLYNFDAVALSTMGHGSEIGLYMACYRCITILSPALAQIQLSIFPTFARSYMQPGELEKQSRKWAAWVSIPLVIVAILFTLFASPVLRIVFGGDYITGAPILRVLAWTLPFQGLRGVLRQRVLASHLQMMDTRNAALALTVNIILDVLLIPKYGALGCAASSLCSELTFLAATQNVIWRKLPVAASR